MAVKFTQVWQQMIQLFDSWQENYQWIAMASSVFVGLVLLGILKKTLLCPTTKFRQACEKFGGIGQVITSPFLSICLVAWGIHTLFVTFEWPVAYFFKFCYLVSAWAIYFSLKALVKNMFLPRLVALLGLFLVILELFNLRVHFLGILEAHVIKIGDLSIHPYYIFNGVISVGILFWLADLLTKAVTMRMQTKSKFDGSTRVLIAKVFGTVFYVGSILVGLSVAGVPLANLTFFSGAVGIGLGFGMQKVISNFVSGFILLIDKSIKPGDVIEVGTTYGWISSIRARYVSVVTPDRKEHLIPNEDLIVNRVVNWSFSDTKIRCSAFVGVAYHSDLDKVSKICLEVIRSTPRVLSHPEPSVLLHGFGASSIDLELVFWLTDPKNGVANVKSDILFALWRRFKAEGIEIPFPQQDVYIKQLPNRLPSDEPSTHQQQVDKE